MKKNKWIGTEIQYELKRKRYRCYIAQFDIEKGITIKALDIDRIKKVGLFYGKPGEEDNMICYNLKHQSENNDVKARMDIFIKKLEAGRRRFTNEEINTHCDSEGFGMSSCAFM